MLIEDGGGNGRVATVNADNQFNVFAVTHTADQHINAKSGKVWSIPFEGLNPTATGDYVIYIRNDGDKVVSASDIRISADTAATQITIEGVTGTAIAGSTITPVSRTIGSAAIPSATVESGADITGLTSSGVLFYMQLAVVNTEYHLNTTSKILIPKGRAIAISVETATANLTGVISLIEEEDL